MRLTPRKTYLVDSKLQGALVLRALGYWCFCLLSIGLIALCWEAAFGPDRSFIQFFDFDQLWQHHGAAVLAAFLLLPVLLLDVLVTSNRFAGPLQRLRRSLRALAAGEFVQPVQFREHDFWHDLAAEFNDVAAYVERLKQELAAARPANSPLETSDNAQCEPAGKG